MIIWVLDGLQKVFGWFVTIHCHDEACKVHFFPCKSKFFWVKDYTILCAHQNILACVPEVLSDGLVMQAGIIHLLGNVPDPGIGCDLVAPGGVAVAAGMEALECPAIAVPAPLSNK